MAKTLRRLTRISVAVMLIAMLSYGLGANLAVRFINPSAGAWWNGIEFWLMEGAATTFGVLLGIRLVARMLADSELWSRALNPVFLVAAALVAPLTMLTSAAARSHLGGFNFSRRAWLIGSLGYDAGTSLENLAAAATYVLKTAALGALCGVALAAAMLAIYLAFEVANQSSPAATGAMLEGESR